MFVWCKNSNETVLTNARMGRSDRAALSLHGAKNSIVRGQMILRDFADFTIESVEFTHLTGCVRAETLSASIQGYQLYNDGIPYPDRLLPVTPTAVMAHRAQSVWVQVSIPADADTGTGAFTMLCHTSAGDVTARFTLRVYDVSLPEPADGAFDHEYFFNFNSLKAYNNAFQPFTQPWRELMGAYADAMKALRVNCLYLNLYPLLAAGNTRQIGEQEWQLDFSYLDAFVRFFLHRGSFRHLVLTALCDSLTGAHLHTFDASGALQPLDAQTDACRIWAETLYGAVYTHFKENGWLDMLLVHIADEPHQTDHWKWMRGILRRVMPGVRCSEPLDMHESALELAGECDVFVPRLEVYEAVSTFFADRQKQGDTVWCYSCCYPEQPWYLNKFIDQPSRYSRLIKWACYSQGITGFLHWGFNFWDIALYGMDPASRFKGDGFIVYPDAAHRSLLPSNRGLATAEGIQDYELLKLAEKKDPDAAKAISLSVARSFSDFTDDPNRIELARVELLSLCES